MDERDYLTETVTLPVSAHQAVIREADGHAERLLYSRGNAVDKALPGYVARLTVELNGKRPSEEDILNLAVPDFHFLLIRIQQLSYAEPVVLQQECPNCRASASYAVPLDKLDMLPLPEGGEPADPTWEVELPRSKRRVTWGYPTARDELNRTDEGIDPTSIELRHIRQIDGAEATEAAVMALSRGDVKWLRREITAQRCGYDNWIRFTHECGYQMELNLLIDPGFLWAGLAGLRSAP